jgi:hypothetical protein
MTTSTVPANIFTAASVIFYATAIHVGRTHSAAASTLLNQLNENFIGADGPQKPTTGDPSISDAVATLAATGPRVKEALRGAANLLRLTDAEIVALSPPPPKPAHLTISRILKMPIETAQELAAAIHAAK